MALKKVRYTKQRGGKYHLNIPIAPAIRGLYGGKAAFEKSTKSADPIEAERQVTAQRAHMHTQLKETERRADQARLKSLLDPADAAIVNDLGGIQNIAARINDLREQAAFAAGTENATDLPPDADVPPDVMRDMHQQAEQAAQKAFQDSMNAQMRNLKKVAKTLNEPISDAPDWADEGITHIRELAEKMAVEKSYTPENLRKLQYTVRRWIEWHGDMPLDKFTRQHLASFADGLKGLPTTNKREIQNMPMRAAITKGKEDKLATMAHKTREIKVDHIKSLTKFAVGQGDMTADPFAGYELIKPKIAHAIAAKDDKRPYTPAQVTVVLAHCKKTFSNDLIDYWLPPIAAYTGARREEIGQLHVADIADWNGRFTIRITDEEEDQSIKNKHSFRTIPVPTVIMKLGFEQFVSRRRQAGHKMLFLEPFTHNKTKKKTIREIQSNGNGKYTGTYGQRYERKVTVPLGLKGQKLSIHSFRHSWTDAARRAKNDPETRRLIAGRLDGEDAIESGYGGADLLKEKLGALDKVAPYLTKSRSESQLIN